MSKTSLTSDNAKSVEMLTSLAQLNGMDEDEMAVRMNGSEEQLPVREKLSKRFGIISLTQRNLTVDEATTKPTLV